MILVGAFYVCHNDFFESFFIYFAICMGLIFVIYIYNKQPNDFNISINNTASPIITQRIHRLIDNVRHNNRYTNHRSAYNDISPSNDAIVQVSRPQSNQNSDT